MRISLAGAICIALALSPLKLSAVTTQFSLTIAAGRQIVVDRQGRVVELWSNVTPMTDSYQLLVTQDSINGQSVAMTTGVLEQYRAIVERVPAGVGRVFPQRINADMLPTEGLLVRFEQSIGTVPNGPWREVVTYAP